MRRRTLLAAVAGLAVLVAVGVFMPWPQQHRITRENFERIHKGMTHADVEAILGPAGDYSSGPTRPDPDSKSSRWAMKSGFGGEDDAFPLARTAIFWNCDELWVAVAFGPHATVTGAEPIASKRVDQGPLENLLWRAKRQWRKWFPS
jgi:hypothetical protein